jgi:exonuclease III
VIILGKIEGDNTKATKIYAANVRGLVKNLKLINTLNLESYHVLLLSEIWNVKDFEHVNINGFEAATVYQRTGQRGGGVAIFIKSGLKIKILNGIINDGITESIGININGLNVFCVYRPPSCNKQLFVEDLCKLMDYNNGRKVVIGGDFNINNFVPNNAMTNWANLYNLKTQINGITRPESGTCLDNFFSNVNGKYWISNTSIADHLSIIAEIESETQKSTIKKFKYRQMKEENWLMFGITLRTIEIKGENINSKWENLCNDIQKSVIKCFPEKFSKREYKFSMSPSLLKSRDKKNELLKKYKQGKINKKIYIDYNRVYRKLIIAEKEREFGTKLKNAGTNSKKNGIYLRKNYY